MSFKKNDWRSQSLRFLLTWMVKVLFRECRGRMEEKQASMYRKRKERCCAVVCRFDWSSLIGRRCSLPCRARPTTLYIWWPGCCPSWHTQSIRFLGPTFCFFFFPFCFFFLFIFVSFSIFFVLLLKFSFGLCPDCSDRAIRNGQKIKRNEKERRRRWKEARAKIKRIRWVDQWFNVNVREKRPML